MSVSIHIPYDFTLKELLEIMELRNSDGVKKVNKLGGIQTICDRLHTSPTNGLGGDKTDLEKRQEIFGSNQIPPQQSKNFFQLVFIALQDPTLIILQIAALISILLSFYQPPSDVVGESTKNNWVEGGAIFIVVVIIVIISAFNDYSKDRQFRGLQKRILNENTFLVMRNGILEELPINNIVVGDICLIKYGDLIPADGLVIQSNDLSVDESHLTGESDHVKKSPTKDVVVLSGTRVMEGSGKIVVTAVGLNSQTGIILKLLGTVNNQKKKKKRRRKMHEEEDDESVVSIKSSKSSITRSSKFVLENEETIDKKSILQMKLTKLAIRISYFGTTVALLTFIILVMQYCVKTFVTEQRHWKNHYINQFVQYFIIGITILVVAVPEGLPLAITISLAYSVKRMMKDNNLVRHLDACETMGNATTICSDKTGTLTTNCMTVEQSYICKKNYETTPAYSDLPPFVAQLIVNAISINTAYTSEIVLSDNPREPPKQIGNKTDCALLSFVLALGQNYKAIRDKNPIDSFLHVYTFNSLRKSMSTIIRNDKDSIVYTKGASEIVLDKCAFIYGSNGHIDVLNDQERKRIMKDVIKPMAFAGLRTICIAYKELLASSSNTNQNWNNEDYIVSNLTCLCIVGIEDPVRSDVPEAIKKCQNAGIVVRMITGDNINTAKSIALKCGIVKPGDNSLILEGKEFNRRIKDGFGHIRQERLDEIWPRLRVLARSTPIDKYNLVKGIIDSQTESGEVVAVTGDGTNDGPALRIADVGFAMGITGTDIAKEASDIILIDDNFSSIVKAVIWGRNIYDNIGKFLQFQLTVNLVAVVTAFVGACIQQDSPLKAVPMLWVNLIIDTLASLALATEVPTEKLLQRKPYGRTKPLITRTMAKNIIGQSVYQLTILFFIMFVGKSFIKFQNQPDEKLVIDTIIFNTLVTMTHFLEITSRKIHGERNVFAGLISSPFFYTIWVFTFTCQATIIHFGKRAFSTTRLTLRQWGWCIGFGVSVLIWNQVINTISVNDQIPSKIQQTKERHGPAWFRNRRRVHSAQRILSRIQPSRLEINEEILSLTN